MSVTGQVFAAALTASLAFAQDSRAQDGDPHRYIIATAAEGGSYYPIGVALALVARVNLNASAGIDMEAVTSTGTVENVRLLADGVAQLAIVQDMIGQWAWEGGQMFADAGPQTHLRAITALWPDVSHFLIRSDLAQTGTVDDLAALEGLGFAVGGLGSGAEFANRFLLENYGFDFNSWSLAFMQFDETLQALRDGTIAGANILSGLGVEVVRRALAEMGEGLTLLSVTEEQAARFDAGSGRVFAATIPPGTYPAHDAALPSIAQPNFLAVEASVPDEDVYLITRTIYENLDYLCELHGAACDMALETGPTGLPVPLHPGAERYYREMGITLPGDPDQHGPMAE